MLKFSYTPQTKRQAARVLARKAERPSRARPERSEPILLNDAVADLAGYVRRSGMGSTAVAEEAGLTPQTVYRMLDGTRTPRLKTLEAIAGVFGKRIGLIDRGPRS